MRKTIAWLLLCMLLMSALSVFSVSADSTAAGYKLVTHWDFEGENPYADKATEGVSDTLSAVGAVGVSNGIATVDKAADVYLKASGAEGTDLHDMTNKTVLLKAKLSETKRKVVAAFLTKIDCFAFGVQIAGSDTQADWAAISYQYYTGEKKGVMQTLNTAVNSTQSMVMDEFRMFAMSFAYDEATDTLTVNQYMSTKEAPESGDDFILLTSHQLTQPHLKTDGDFVLGKRFGHLSADRGLSAAFDEVKVFEGILTPAQMAAESPEERPEPEQPVPAATCGYTVGDKMVAYIQADDKYYVTVDNNAWTNTAVSGAMSDNAMVCKTVGTAATGDGLMLTFPVPAEGTYYIWARMSYPSPDSNSLLYAVDGAGESIWDLYDEEEGTPCYGSWHYVLLTERREGTFTDATQYSQTTIDNGEWRHAPRALTLSEGQHTLKLVGRESGMSVDEFVVTTYAPSEYDPNAFEGNVATLPSCVHCGSGVKHYYADRYAQSGLTAQKYFSGTLHTDAVYYSLPSVTLPAGSAGGAQAMPSVRFDKNETEVETTTAAAADTTAAVVEEKKSGCGSALGMSALLILSCTTACAVGKRKTRQRNGGKR